MARYDVRRTPTSRQIKPTETTARHSRYRWGLGLRKSGNSHVDLPSDEDVSLRSASSPSSGETGCGRLGLSIEADYRRNMRCDACIQMIMS